MKTGDKIKGNIIKDGNIIFQNKTVEIYDGGEYQTLGNDGLWFQITSEEPIGLVRGETCQLIADSRNYKIEVSENINAGLLTFITFSIL